jgi:hypothetical protein
MTDATHPPLNLESDHIAQLIKRVLAEAKTFCCINKGVAV